MSAPMNAIATDTRLAVRTRRVEGAPVASFRLWVRGGARVEEIPGQAVVTGRLLSEGTARRGWREIAEQTEARGMMLTTFGTAECHGVAIDALAGDWELALDWAAELLLEPSFPADRCDWVARQTAAELESLADQPDVVTAWAFLEQLYSPHPRARPLQGDPASLLALTPDDCAAFHRRTLAGSLLVAAAGAFDAEAVERRVRERFADLPVLAAPYPEPSAPLGMEAVRREVMTPGEDQAHLYAGHLTIPRDHPDYTALEVVAVVLGAGAGLTGRIPHRIREQEGLAYSASAQTIAGAGLDAGRLVAYVGTSPATVAQAERGVAEEIARLAADGVTDVELEEARAYLLGREPFKRETARQWAEILVEAEHYRLPIDDPELRRQSLEALDRETIEAAARRHLRPAELRVTVGLPGEADDQDADEAGDDEDDEESKESQEP